MLCTFSSREELETALDILRIFWCLRVLLFRKQGRYLLPEGMYTVKAWARRKFISNNVCRGNKEKILNGNLCKSECAYHVLFSIVYHHLKNWSLAALNRHDWTAKISFNVVTLFATEAQERNFLRGNGYVFLFTVLISVASISVSRYSIIISFLRGHSYANVYEVHVAHYLIYLLFVYGTRLRRIFREKNNHNNSWLV